MRAAAHRCQWPGCGKEVPASLWGCAVHWRRLPGGLKRRLRQAYTPGQEADRRRMTREYDRVYREILEWIGGREA